MIDNSPYPTMGLIILSYFIVFFLISYFMGQLDIGDGTADCEELIEEIEEEEDIKEQCNRNINCEYTKKHDAKYVLKPYDNIGADFKIATESLTDEADLIMRDNFRDKMVYYCSKYGKDNLSKTYDELTEQDFKEEDGNFRLTTDDINFRNSKLGSLNGKNICEELPELINSSCKNKSIDEITELNINDSRYVYYFSLFFLTMLSVGFLGYNIINKDSLYDLLINKNKDSEKIVNGITLSVLFIILVLVLWY